MEAIFSIRFFYGLKRKKCIFASFYFKGFFLIFLFHFFENQNDTFFKENRICY